MSGCENYVDDKLIGIKVLTKAKGEKKWREGPELKGSDLNTGGSTPNVVKLGRKVSKSKPMKVKARFTVEATNLTEDVAGTPVGTRLVESSVEEGSAIKLSRK